MTKANDELTTADLRLLSDDVRAAAEIYNNAVDNALDAGISINPVFTNGAKILFNSITYSTEL